MKKYNVMGYEMVKLTDLCYGLRRTRKEIDSPYGRKSEAEKAGMRKAVENMTRFVFAEEIRNAKDDDEIKAILEIKGDFIVYKTVDRRRRAFRYFGGYVDHEAVITDKASGAMHFAYEGMAEHVAGKLGKDWGVCDTCQAAYEDMERLLHAIFDDDGANRTGDSEDDE